MSESIHYHQTQDYISFNLRAEQVIINDTVKLSATVVAMIAGDTPQETLRSDIRAMMKKLIDVEWQFSNMTRAADDSGWEKVTLTASARVKENQCFNLEERKDAIRRKGLAITEIVSDTSVPFALLDEAESTLRLTLLANAQTELKKIKDAAGDQLYRLHEIEYLERSISGHHNMNSRSASIANSSIKTSYGSGFSDDDALGNASKITMVARVRLARFAPPC